MEKINQRNHCKKKQQLGKAILKLRKEQKISQECLSEKIGVSVSTLYRIEKGAANVTFNSMLDIASGLNISLSSIILQCEGKDDNNE